MEYDKTALIVNDEIGEMAFAFLIEGFHIAGDVVQQKQNMEIVSKNLDIPVYEMTTESFATLPAAAVLAGRLNAGMSVAHAGWELRKENVTNTNIFKYIERNRPKILLFEAPGSLREDFFVDFRGRILFLGYEIYYGKLDVSEMTGMPLREKRTYIVGIRQDMKMKFGFPAKSNRKMPWEEIFKVNDEKRYISLEQAPKIRYEGDGIYDFRQECYVKSETVGLGVHIPFVLKNEMARRLSVKEMMLLKGMPQDYNFGSKADSWIKREVAGSANVIITRMLVSEIKNLLWKENNAETPLNLLKSKEPEKVNQKEKTVKNKIIQKEKDAKDIINREEQDMERRYDVFVSSTYEDLIEERKEITQAVLECDCMPVGMEMFPAANMTQWDFIKRVIDKSDIYLVIVAGKYGSIGSDEQGKRISYTEMEYDYAKSIGKPILAFLYEDLNNLKRDKIELDNSKAAALEAFREKIRSARMVKFFKNKDELKAKAISGINFQKKQLTTGGWVRAAQRMPQASSELEIQKLMTERKQLLVQLQNTRQETKEAVDRENNLRLKYEDVKQKVTKLAQELQE